MHRMVLSNVSDRICIVQSSFWYESVVDFVIRALFRMCWSFDIEWTPAVSVVNVVVISSSLVLYERPFAFYSLEAHSENVGCCQSAECL